MQFLANTSENEELSVPSPRQRRYRSLDQNMPIFLRKSEGATRLTIENVQVENCSSILSADLSGS